MAPLINIGEEAPLFQCTDLRGDSYVLAELRGWIVGLYFWSAECAWCERVDHQVLKYLDGRKEKVKVLWLASNTNESLDLIESIAAERKLPIVILDVHQKVAKQYGAEVTPHFFIVDKNGKLVYQGAWDDITFRQRVATQEYVPQVVEALMQGIPPLFSQTPPYGCGLVLSSLDDHPS